MITFPPNIDGTTGLQKLVSLGLYIIIFGIIACALLPVTSIYQLGIWISFVSLVFFGLGWARVAVHSIGFDITDKSIFTEVVASTDAIARLWQTSIYSACVFLGKLDGWHYTLPVIAILGGLIVNTISRKESALSK